jgi:hypothetical protein
MQLKKKIVVAMSILIFGNMFSESKGADISIETGIEIGAVTNSVPPPTASASIDFEYGAQLGVNFQFNDKNSIGVSLGGMIGGFSLIYLSYIDLQLSYLFGDKINDFAIGPIIGSNWYGIIGGCAIYYKNFYAKPSIIWDYYHNKINGICSFGYSFPLSKNGKKLAMKIQYE